MNQRAAAVQIQQPINKRLICRIIKYIPSILGIIGGIFIIYKIWIVYTCGDGDGSAVGDHIELNMMATTTTTTEKIDIGGKIIHNH